MPQADALKLIEQACLALLTIGVGSMARFLSSISKSVVELNMQVAIVLERTATHARAIDRHDERLSELEKKKGAR